jgi:small basic protein (TIGR04137 family)
MTMDKSLRVRKGSSAARGVLSRAERIVKLKEQEKWGDGRSPLGLPKVRVYKMAMKKKKKAKEEGAEAAGGKGAAAKVLLREIQITEPKIIVCMGAATAAFINRIKVPLAEQIDPESIASVQR